MPDEPTATGGLTLTGLGRQWRGEAGAHDPGKISLFGDLDGVKRGAYARALRDCAAELDSVAVTRVLVVQDELQYVLAHIADEMQGIPEPSHWDLPLFRELVGRLRRAVEVSQ
jgi:hypothetical protein